MQESDKKQANENYGLFMRTPNPDCIACQQKRMHLPNEWKEFHPEAGTGISHDRKLAGG